MRHRLHWRVQVRCYYRRAAFARCSLCTVGSLRLIAALEALRDRDRSEVLVSQNPIVPAARPIRSQSTGIVRELAQAFRGNGSRSQRASSAASHRPFASSHMPRRHQARRHARAVSQSPRASQTLGGWVYVHVPLFAVLCLGSRAGSHPHCLVRSYVVSANSKCGVMTQDAAESMKSMRSW